MDRKEFIINLGKSTAAVCMACYLASCGDDDSNPSAPSNVDFTLDLTLSANQALNNVGGTLYKDGIIIARVSQTSFIALSQYCTHQGTTVQFEANNNRFHCPQHGSNYRTDGTVINGPAERALVKYNAELSGTSLRVYS